MLSISSSIVDQFQADYTSIDAGLSLSQYTAGRVVSARFTASAEHGYDQSGFNSLYATLPRIKKDYELDQLADGGFPIRPSIYAGNVSASLLSTTPIQDGVLSFRPIDDFTPDNVDAYTYFDQSHGLGYTDEVRRTAVTQSWMPAAPNVTSSGWIRDNEYKMGDVVQQLVGTKIYLSGSSYSSGSELTRNGKYYVCQPESVNVSNGLFKSLHPPQLDGDNWVPLKHHSVWYQRLVRYAYTGGNTNDVSVLKDIIVPGLTVSGTGIPVGSVISSITDGTHFYMDNSATVTNTAAELTLTDSDGNSFVIQGAIVHTGSTDAKRTVTHVARYDSLPNEYTTKHFRFHREDSLGARRRTYVGTMNTATTSFEFGQPFEVFDVNVNTIRVGTNRASGTGGGTTGGSTGNGDGSSTDDGDDGSGAPLL